MAKAIRVFVILGLMLSIGALALGVLLFRQREQLKGRTQKMEEAVLAVAQTLTAPRAPHVSEIQETVDREPLKTWAAMDAPLSLLRRIVENRYEELVTAYADLSAEKATHQQTRTDLARTRQELAEARQEVARVRENLARTEAELATARQTISRIEGQVRTLTDELEGVRGELDVAREKVKDLEDELLVLRRLDDRDLAAVPQMTGQVLLVNPEWNFIILDLGEESKLKPTVEMVVHRGDRMVGKVRVSSVMERVSVAEIQRDWEQFPIQEGDRVFN